MRSKVRATAGGYANGALLAVETEGLCFDVSLSKDEAWKLALDIVSALTGQGVMRESNGGIVFAAKKSNQ